MLQNSLFCLHFLLSLSKVSVQEFSPKLEKQNWLDFSRSYLEMPLVTLVSFFFAHSIIASSLFGNDLKRFGSQLRNSSRNQLKMLPKHDCLGCHIEFLPKFSWWSWFVPLNAAASWCGPKPQTCFDDFQPMSNVTKGETFAYFSTIILPTIGQKVGGENQQCHFLFLFPSIFLQKNRQVWRIFGKYALLTEKEKRI